MLPLVNTAFIPVTTQPTLVDTALPGNNAQRVLPDVAPPTVSSPRTEPDARGNPQFFSPRPATPATLPEITPQPTPGRELAGRPFGTPATLIAQLIGQPVPEQTGRQLQTILQEYEKLIAFSQTKYAPSNATRPQAEPAGAFGRLLEQSNSTTRTAGQSSSVVTSSAPAAAATPVASARPAATPRAASNSRDNNENAANRNAIENDGEEEDISVPAIQAIPTRGIRSYQASLLRNEAIAG